MRRAPTERIVPVSASFVYQPHVASGSEIVTPDLIVDRLIVAHGIGPGAEPGFAELPVQRLTTDIGFQHPGDRHHGSAAFALVAAGRGDLITVASAHRDRAAGDGRNQATSAHYLACAKPLSRQAWRLPDVSGHFDRLVLRWQVEGAGKGEVALADVMRPDALLDRVAGTATVPRGTCLICDLGVPDASPVGAAFTVALHDPQLGRTIDLRYRATPL